MTKKVLLKQLKLKNNVLKILRQIKQMVLSDLDALEGWSITEGIPPSFFDGMKQNRREVLEKLNGTIKEIEKDG